MRSRFEKAEQAASTHQEGVIAGRGMARFEPVAHVTGSNFDIGKGADPFQSYAIFGHEQLHGVLMQHSHGALKEAAAELGIRPGHTKAETVSRIAEHVTRTPHADVLAHYQAHPNEPYHLAHPEAVAKGAAPKAPRAAKAEGIHERSARLQREGGLQAEVQPVGARGHLEAIGRVHESALDPYAPPNPSALRTLYGEHQLGAALSRYSGEKVREAARQVGVTPGRSKAETVSRITAAVTEGRYSANFAKGEGSGSAKPRSRKASQ
jgi:hypothetical protein